MCFIFIIGENWKENVVKKYKSIIFISLVGIFLIYLLSYFNSENKTAFFDILKNKVPYLFIAFSILYIGNINKKKIKITIYIYILCALINSFWSYFQYQKNIEYYTNLYTKGEVIPTLIHHVALSYLLCVCVLFILNNIVKSNLKIEKIINGICLIWIVYFIHILSVRTGILLLYISVFLFSISILITQKKVAFAGSLIVILLLSSYIAYQKIPTLKSKISYTIYGLQQLKTNTDSTNQVSDTRRILSQKIGLNIIKENKLLGIGFGDIQTEMNNIYKKDFPTFSNNVYSKIHNQYLYVFASVGLIFGLIFCILLLLILVQFIKEKNAVFAIAYFCLLLLMFWESFIENQIGNSIFLLICCFGFTNKSNND